MDAERKRRLEEAGFKFGTVGELFNLSEVEEQIVEMKLAMAEAIRALRDRRDLSQADLARLVGSGQARISKLERACEATSLDGLVRCMFALGASRKDLAQAIAPVRGKAKKAKAGQPKVRIRRVAAVKRPKSAAASRASR